MVSTADISALAYAAAPGGVSVFYLEGSEPVSRKTDSYNQLPASVRFVNETDFKGNIIVRNWFKWLKYPDGKPHMNALYILADIVYWHRPTEELDEKTGKVIGYRTKFSGEKLQRSRNYYEAECGFTNKQVKDTLAFLADEVGVIVKIIKDVVILENGETLSNVLYLDLVPEVLYRITFTDPADFEGGVGPTGPRGGRTYKSEGGSDLQVRGVGPTGPTYTKNTLTKTLHEEEEEENKISRSEDLEPNLETESQLEDPGISPTKTAAIHALYMGNVNISESPIIWEEINSDSYQRLPLSWWVEAVKIACANSARRWVYIQAILDRSIEAGQSPEVLGPPQRNGASRSNGHSHKTSAPRSSPLPSTPAAMIPKPMMLTKIQQVEQEWKSILRPQMTEQTFTNLFQEATLSKPNGKYCVTTKTRMAKEWIEGRFMDKVKETLSTITQKPVEVIVVVEGGSA